MDTILQGTTPYLVIDFADTGLDVADFDAAELTVTSGSEKRTYDLDDMDVDAVENTLTYHFSEGDTLALSATAAVFWQIYVKVDDEVFGTRPEQVKIFTKMKGEAMS
jgi:hypothetical protein